jgi:hypothetical protein
VLSSYWNGGNRRGIEQSRDASLIRALFFSDLGDVTRSGIFLIDAQFLRVGGRTRTAILAGQTLREVRRE